jgi:hypothetical protein
METPSNLNFALFIGALVFLFIGFLIGKNAAIVSVIKEDSEFVRKNINPADNKRETPEKTEKPDNKITTIKKSDEPSK